MKRILIIFFVAALSAACSKDDNTPAPKPESVKITSVSGIKAGDILYVGRPVQLSAVVEAEGVLTYQWSVDGKAISNGTAVSYVPERQGLVKVKFTASTATVKEETEIEIYVFRPASDKSSKWISELVEYLPAPGQFINKSPGNMASAEGIVGKKGMVTLGGYGGYVVFGFDHTVLNNAGADFVVHGNAFSGSSEPGIVMVAFDANGNGKPDADEWFELKGSEYEKSQKNYGITYFRPSQTEKAENVLWRDSKGVEGQVTAITFHRQCYYPLFLADDPTELKFTGTLVPGNATENNGIWKLNDLAWGYVDNASEDYSEVIGSDNDTKAANKFDIDNAVDKDGKTVKLKGVDFVKVYNCLNQEAGWLGETSTEVCGAISLTAKAK